MPGFKRPLVRPVCNIFLSEENPFSAHGRKFRMGFFVVFNFSCLFFYAQGLTIWSVELVRLFFSISLININEKLLLLASSFVEKIRRWNQCPCFVVVAYLWMIYFFGTTQTALPPFSILFPFIFIFIFLCNTMLRRQLESLSNRKECHRNNPSVLTQKGPQHVQINKQKKIFRITMCTGRCPEMPFILNKMFSKIKLFMKTKIACEVWIQREWQRTTEKGRNRWSSARTDGNQIWDSWKIL